MEHWLKTIEKYYYGIFRCYRPIDHNRHFVYFKTRSLYPWKTFHFQESFFDILMYSIFSRIEYNAYLPIGNILSTYIVTLNPCPAGPLDFSPPAGGGGWS